MLNVASLTVCSYFMHKKDKVLSMSLVSLMSMGAYCLPQPNGKGQTSPSDDIFTHSIMQIWPP